MKLIPIFLPENSCPFHCAFCNVRIANGEDAPVHSPGDVRRIIETALATLAGQHPGETVEVAFFGGTFTAGDPALMAAYLAPCKPFLADERINGIRVSTRPDCVGDSIINLLKKNGVTSVELGVESFDDNVLNSLNRGHSAKTAIHAIQLLQQNGLVTGIHLMAGCPGESDDSFRHTVRTTLRIHPDTVRIHPLLVLAGTRLTEKGFQAPGCEAIIDKLALATYCFEQAGIAVIRIGLQPTESLNRPGQVLSGCYHAALRHLVMSRIYRKFLNQLTMAAVEEVSLCPAHLSYGIGFKRENAIAFPGLMFRGDPSLQQWDARITGTCYHMLTEGVYEIT